MSEFLRLKMAQNAGLETSTALTSPSAVAPHAAPPIAGPHFHPAPFSLTAPAASVATPIQLQAVQLKKNYRKGQVDIPVLKGVDLQLRQGELLSIVGQSGSGKSTLLHLLGTLDAPTAGEVHFDGRRIDNLPARERDLMRNSLFGMIFQFYHLLPELTTLENVLSPLMIRHGTWSYRRRRREHVARARELLEMVGLSHRLKHRPSELSGGEMQRTAIARALVSDPKILLADEPTGNLDQETGREILRILGDLNRNQKLSIVMVTHDPAIAAGADRVVRLVAGRMEEASWDHPATPVLPHILTRRRNQSMKSTAPSPAAQTADRKHASSANSASVSQTAAPLKIFISGKLYDQADAKISVYDHGLLYGDGVFEGIRSYSGKVFRLDQHLERLWNSARAIWLEIPMTREAMARAVRDTLAANNLQDGYIRLVVTRGAGTLGLDPNRTSNPQVIIITDKIAMYPEEHYRNGLEIVTASTIRNNPAALSPRIKSLNYLNNILAKIEGYKAGCIEALMLNHKGEVAECTGDNIFIIRRGEVLTPPNDAGILEGVTREAVMELARASGREVHETPLTRHDLYIADECFLTGTAAEVIPVVKLDGRTIGNGAPGPITRDLIERFHKLTRE